MKIKDQKEEIICAKPKQNGWWSCDSCPSQNFLFFFELIAHWREYHNFDSNVDINTSKYHYEKMTIENQIERDTNLAKDNWTCHACEYGEKFEHKFQLVNHWHKQHSNQEIMYEVCQWCSELFTSPDSCKTVSI